MKNKFLSFLSSVARGMIIEHARQFQVDNLTVSVIDYAILSREEGRQV